MIGALLANAFFAAIAGAGFGSLSNPPKRALLMAAILSACGNTFRFFLMKGPAEMHIITATMCAAFLIGVAGFATGRKLKLPAEIFTFPAMLPMIPGIFAYNAVLSTIDFVRCTNPEEAAILLVNIFSYGAKTAFILAALVIGASMSVFIDTLSTERQTYRFTLLKELKRFRKD